MTKLAVSALAICALTTGASADETSGTSMDKLVLAPRGTEVEIETGAFMTLYRLQVKPTAKDGWVHARSTKGDFTVDVPTAFNDYAMRTTSTDNVGLQADMIGGTAGDVKWSAVCMARADGTLSPPGQTPPSGDHIEAMGDPVRAYSRMIVLAKRTCLLTVEATGHAAVPSAKDRKRFFASFKSTQKK